MAAERPPVAQLRDLGVLVDPTGQETIETVASAEPDRFRPLPGGNLAAGYTRDVHWLRFRVEAPPGEWWLVLLPPYLDDLRLHEPDRARPGSFLERRAGDRLPFADREVPYRGFVFRLDVPPGAPREYYLRLETTSTSILVPRLLSPEAFHASTPGEYGLLLALLAVILIVAVMSAQSWLWLRERVYLLFFAYLAAMVLALIATGGFAAQYVLPDRPGLADAWVGVGTMASFAAFALWCREILRAGPGHGPVAWLTAAVVVLALAGMAAVPLGFYPETARLVNVVTLLLITWGLWVVGTSWRRGAGGRSLQLAAIFASLVAFGWSLLSLLGLLPGRLLLLNGPNLAVVGSIVALHLALSDRYRRVHEERRIAEHDAAREREVREQQGKFLDVVAHEYRTPLAVLKTNLDILGLTGDEAARRGSLARMENAVRRLAEILDGNLRQGTEGAQSPIALETIDPGVVLRELAAQAADPATGSIQEVQVRGTEGIRVRADRRLLSTIFRNLLDNARKYSTPDSPLDVGIEAEAGAVAIRFANDCAASPGGSTAGLDRKYVRGENARGIPGQGMGLYLVRKLLEDQGGSLVLRLEPRGRFVAIVTLPQDGPGGAT